MKTIKLKNSQAEKIQNMLWDEYVMYCDSNEYKAANETLDILERLGAYIPEGYRREA